MTENIQQNGGLDSFVKSEIRKQLRNEINRALIIIFGVMLLISTYNDWDSIQRGFNEGYNARRSSNSNK